jgi:hypothetical protein
MAMDGSDGLAAAAKLVYPTMPSLLCTWHVSKRILAKCKSKFTTNSDWNAFFSSWHALVQSPTSDIFEERWLQFTLDYDHGITKQCISYIKSEWIKPGQIERLVAAWTN